MSQTYTIDCFGSGHIGMTDLQNMENNFESLRTLFSGSSAPSNTSAGAHFFDTTKKVFKIRNTTDSEWLGVMYGNTNYKIWVYINSAGDGWVVDSGHSDKVLAIKGGSQAYNVNGGNDAGTWTQPSHALTTAQIPAHTHTDTFYRSNGAAIGPGNTPGRATDADNPTTVTSDPTGGGNSHNHGTTYRPAAAVGTLQYPNV